MRIIWDNLVDYSETVVTAGSEAADLPVSNILHHHRTRVYRTGASSAAEYILIDFGSARAVQALVLLDHTLTNSDSGLKLQGNATNSWGSPSVDETLTFHAGTLAHFLSAAQTYRWWRISFTKSAAGESRDIGRVFLGPYYECVKDISFGGLTIKPVDLSDTKKSLGGQTYSNPKDIYDEIDAEFGYILDAQMTAFRTIAAATGTHTPFFISCDPTSKPYDWLYYVKFAEFQAQKVEIYKSSLPMWSTRMKFEEQL